MAAGIPAERVSAPDEVTATVSWLVSDAAGDVRGAEIPIDGGIRSARLR
nr:SDR family oxidoreductase [Streptomyces sp. SID8382]